MASLTLAVIFFGSGAVMAAVTDGRLDRSFGSGGRVLLSFGRPTPAGPSSPDVMRALSVQPDGKVIVAGDDFTLARLVANGRLDPDFGRRGIVHKTSGVQNARGVAWLPGGRIVVAGSAVSGGAGTSIKGRFVVARYTPSGRLDQSFGVRGRTVLTHFRLGSRLSNDDELAGLAVQGDGKLVIAGSAKVVGRRETQLATVSRFAVARLDPRGRLDRSFGNAGRAVLDFPAENLAAAGAIALDRSGGIVIAGGVSPNATETDASYHVALARLRTNGRPDQTFGSAGRVVGAPFPGVASATASAVAVQRDGRLVVAGTGFSAVSTDPSAVVGRYEPNGAPDGNFGTAGQAELPSMSVGAAIVNSGLAFSCRRGFSFGESGDGKILLGGSSTPPTAGVPFAQRGPRFTLIRMNPDGSPDRTFGDGGRAISPNLGTGKFSVLDVLNALALQPNGRVAAAGYTSYQATRSGQALRGVAARYLALPARTAPRCPG